MNWMVLPNQVCLIVKLYNNRPGLLPDSNDNCGINQIFVAINSYLCIPLYEYLKTRKYVT